MADANNWGAHREVLNFINGHYVPSALGKTFPDMSPVDGRQIATVHEAGRVEVDAAVQAARAALKGPWGKLPVAERMAFAPTPVPKRRPAWSTATRRRRLPGCQAPR